MSKKAGCPVGYEMFQGSCHKKMTRPKYSSIKWQEGPRGILKTDSEHIIAKGSKTRWEKPSRYGLPFKKCDEHKTINLKIKQEDVITKHSPAQIKIGNSCYDKEYLYRVAEEIVGKKIVNKSGTITKDMVGKNIMLKTRTRSEKTKTVYDELYPIVIEGNNGYYMIAPRFCE